MGFTGDEGAAVGGGAGEIMGTMKEATTRINRE